MILLFGLSCKTLTETERLHQKLTGNWLIISPDHKLKEGSQHIVDSHIQDSIVGLMGLKLITLWDDETFQQVDSTGKKGRWGITADNIVFIEKGGQGFNNFTARFTNYANDMLQLTEFVEAEDEKIELTWNLKKVTGGGSSKLFDADQNEWRERPGQPESEKQIRERLSGMLRYYSGYYKLVTKESNFFIPAGVILPLKFYQHAIGMRPFDNESFFAKLFFSKEQAEQAWQYLKRIIHGIRGDFPRKEDYLEEYAEFMATMSEQIVKD
jgi:hypothetical protein